jgi:hypothetical protein
VPVHRQKKDSTTKTNSPGSMQEQTALPLPDQQTFQQYLRELARGAIRVVLEAVMCEELDTLIGVGWGDAALSAKDTATASTAVIWSPLPVGLRISKCPETGKATSILKCLTGIAATNPTLRKD